MKTVKKYYSKIAHKTTNTLTNIALDKFVKSEYLRDTTSILPLTLLTIATRGTFNFLVTSRLKTGYYFFDFSFAVCITVIFTLSSPFFYNIFNFILDNEVKNFSSSILESFWLEGWIFFELWKGRILGSIGFILIFLLFFIEINSQMIQEFIFHTILSSLIVDYLTQLKITIHKAKEERNSPLGLKILTSPNDVLLSSSQSYTNLEDIETSPLEYTLIRDYEKKKK